MNMISGALTTAEKSRVLVTERGETASNYAINLESQRTPFDPGAVETATKRLQTKAFVSEANVRLHLDAVQVHGGYGYMTEFDVERDLRDAIGGTLYSGTTEIQRRIIARSLGL